MICCYYLYNQRHQSRQRRAQIICFYWSSTLNAFLFPRQHQRHHFDKSTSDCYCRSIPVFLDKWAFRMILFQEMFVFTQSTMFLMLMWHTLWKSAALCVSRHHFGGFESSTWSCFPFRITWLNMLIVVIVVVMIAATQFCTLMTASERWRCRPKKYIHQYVQIFFSFKLES